MGDFKNNSRSFSHRRDLWSRDRTPPQRARDKRETPSAHAPNSATDSSVKMALTCKVQYLDDTDPFASTNFPEPTRPPTYTFHLNIPLFQQIAGLHRLLNAPHNVSVMLLFIPVALASAVILFCRYWCLSEFVSLTCLNLLLQIDDVALQLSHNGCYLDLESSLEEQADLLEGFLDRFENIFNLTVSL